MKRENRNDDHLRWQEISREDRFQTPIFSLVHSLRRSPSGRESSYYLLDSPDWVNIVAITPDEAGRDCFVMVRQFRHGSMRVGLEFPGGVVDPGEEPSRAIVRELQEETGYRADSIRLIGSINPNPAFMSNSCYTYLAESVRLNGPTDPDLDEHIDVELVPVEELLDGTRDDEFEHAMMRVALDFYRAVAGERLSGKG
jgi:ADP-ribose pyrophosphatase